MKSACFLNSNNLKGLQFFHTPRTSHDTRDTNGKVLVEVNTVVLLFYYNGFYAILEPLLYLMIKSYINIAQNLPKT